MTGPVDPRNPKAVAAVGRERMAGEPRTVEFDAALHPGLVYRCLRTGGGVAQAAAIVGVSEAKLKEWLCYPEMSMAYTEAGLRDEEIVRSLESHAIGRPDPKHPGQWVGGNPMLLKFLAETRLGYKKPEPVKDDDFRSADEIRRVATIVMREIMAKREALELTEAETAYVDMDRGRQGVVSAGVPVVGDGTRG